MTEATFTSELLSRMTLAEKIGQLNLVTPGGNTLTGTRINEGVRQKIQAGQVGSIFGVKSVQAVRSFQTLAVTESRLGIPILFAEDVIHGHRTIFPLPLALSCSWDMALIEQTARIAAIEASAEGINQVYGPMLDIARDPRWGRIAESPGEDPYLAARIAEAMVRGLQGDDLARDDTVMACLKHFVAYGAAEGGRDYGGVHTSPERLLDTYLVPFQAGVAAGAGSVMAAFNTVNGVPMHAHAVLLSDVLRRQWGFTGLLVSDYTGITELMAHGLGDLPGVVQAALEAGIDLDMVSEAYVSTLAQLVAAGRVRQDAIDQACQRVLMAKYRLGLFADPYRYLNDQRAAHGVLTPAHRQLARQAAARSCVLLKNTPPVLPLKKSGTIALIGALANDQTNMLGTWAVSGNHQEAVPILQGMQRVAGPQTTIVYAKGANIVDNPAQAARLNVHGQTVFIDERPPQAMIAEAVALACQADVVVAVVGEAKEASGESSSCTDISLPENQKKLLRALQATGKPLVVVVMSGRPLVLQEEYTLADAILLPWFAGTEAGNGIADILFGEVNPAGKLTTTFPYHVGQIPVYYAQEPGGRPFPGHFQKFTSGYLDMPDHVLHHDGLFPFGFGLSYTTFAYSPLRVNRTVLTPDGVLEASVTVQNTGDRSGDEIVQLYITDPVASISRPVKQLRGFQTVSLAPGAAREVTFRLTPEALKFYQARSLTDYDYDWEAGEFVISIGPNARDTQHISIVWERSLALALV